MKKKNKIHKTCLNNTFVNALIFISCKEISHEPTPFERVLSTGNFNFVFFSSRRMLIISFSYIYLYSFSSKLICVLFIYLFIYPYFDFLFYPFSFLIQTISRTSFKFIHHFYVLFFIKHTSPFLSQCPILLILSLLLLLYICLFSVNKREFYCQFPKYASAVYILKFGRGYSSSLAFPGI